jgi:nucleotide-binding universal stress UspA family protein
MNKVCACIDGKSNTPAIIDWALWSARRLNVPLEFLHVLERHPERASVTDYSGAIGLGAKDTLLQELSDLDAQSGKLAQEAGRRLLVQARERAALAGFDLIDGRMRHGELVDTALEMEAEVRLFVLGEHGNSIDAERLHLGHHVERVIRSVKRPVLVAIGEHFETPQRFVIAFDGSATSRKTVETVAGSPLLMGLPALLVTVGTESVLLRQQIDAAQQVLRTAGFSVETRILPGEPEDALPSLLAEQGATLLVMGAYGHSRIRQLVVGSTTSLLLRLSSVPVLILR